MKKFSAFALIFALGAFYHSSSYAARRTNVNIELPFNLKWLWSPSKVNKSLRSLNLKFKTAKWAFFEKENKKYWLYFDGKKKLRQITILFKNMSDFVKYANEISLKYSEIKMKTNYYSNSHTIIDIDSTIRPKIVFLKK
jgi:hypothetical protein